MDLSLELLCFSGDQALLWNDASGSLRTGDLNTGKPSWPIPDVKALLAEAGDESQRLAAKSVEERNFADLLNVGNNIPIRNGQPITQGAFIARSRGPACSSR